ncbi:tail fiber assembly protein, partial [Salmonella enterica]
KIHGHHSSPVRRRKAPIQNDLFTSGNGSQHRTSAPGPLPENVTSVSPDGEYQKWDGKAWVKDEAAEKAAQLRQAEETKSRLLQMASGKIAPLQDAVDLGLATDEEKSQLAEWKKYRVLVNRVNTSSPDWPDIPS